MQYLWCWNDELSGLKRNILHGKLVVSSTSSIFPVHNELFIESSNDTAFSFVLKPNPSQPASDSSVVMLIACGRKIVSNFVSGELARSTTPVLPMPTHVIGGRARYTFTKILHPLLTLFVGRSVPDESYVNLSR
jgi:hypothetical protein